MRYFVVFKSANTWEQRKLGDVASNFEYGLNASAKEFDGENKYIRITDIDDESRVFLSDDITSPDTDLISADKYKLEKGDILFARTGASVGKTYLYREKDGLVYYAGFLIRAKINPENDAEFVFQNTLTDSYDSFIRITSQRSGQPGVNAQEYQGFSFYVPSLKEQQLIGTYFKNLDSLITLHQRSYNLEQKSKTPNAWEQRKLKSITSVITKGTTPLDKSNSGTVNFIKVENIDNSSGEISISQKISKEEHEGYLKRSQLQENDILFSIAGTLGRVTSVNSDILPANTNQALAIIRLKECNLDYIKTFLKSKAVTDYIKRNPTVGAQPNLSLEQVGNLEIQVPSLREQQSIGNYFKSLDNLITLHQRNSYGLHLPQGLYPSAIAWS